MKLSHLFEVSYHEEEIIKDMITALVSSGIKAVNINVFVNSLKRNYPERFSDDRAIEELVRNILKKDENVAKLINDMVYFDVEEEDLKIQKFQDKTSEEKIKDLSHKYVLNKMKL